jgi:restriction endonuclease S subunit
LKEEKNKIGQTDGSGLDLIGVSNEYGLHISRAARIANLSRYQIIKKDWFAYNPMRVNVGSIGIALKPEDEGIVSPDYVVFSCTEKILPDYLLFFLKSDIGLEAIEKNASGAVRKRLYFSDLAKIELNVPSTLEQAKMLVSIQKIETIVKQLKDPIRLDRISQLKQSILQEAIQGKLTAKWRAEREAAGIETEPANELLKRIKAEKARLIKEKKIKKEKPLPPISEEEKPFELPEGWEWCRLGQIYQSTSGGTPSRSNSKFWNGSIDWYKSGELNEGLLIDPSQEKITEKGLNESSATLFPKGTLLIAMYGATAGKLSVLGRSACTNQAVCGFFENQLVNTLYLFHFLSANRQKMVFESWGMSQPNISQTYLRNFLIPLPPHEEQEAIVEKVDSLMAKCAELETEINQSEQYAQELMQAVLKEAFEE